MSDKEHSNTKKKSGGLFGWFKKDKSETPAEPQEASTEPVQADLSVQTETEEPKTELIEETREKPGTEKKRGFFARLKSGLSKTRSNFSEGIASLVLGKKTIDDDLLEEIETQLLMADVGVEATSHIIQDLTEKTARKELTDPEALMARLKELLANMIEPVANPLTIDLEAHKPFVILMVGVNGVGKTTTIGKLAKQLKGQGLSVMLAAGDTFRAAAVEQLQVWGQRNEIPVVAQHEGADSASVIYDALQSAQSKGVDVVIADTAGRLHTKDNLMEELKKVKRVMQKLDVSAPHEVMLVVDAGTGQNALNQAEQFNNAIELTGVTLTKLDGTAKGGVVFALAQKAKTSIRFIGVGEGLEDLRPFHAHEFIDALFDQNENASEE
ncbi:signal recognition particle-docking protein FtsY [Pleionea sediminis]|uniref:signal recognition particle-docking protein FtsY n=1 Tax=Pleionea sediminis TaxID=2569479 RepID=UPI0011866422|nr:signal recognition particle-docking protein FtsY [Pleionea sediminis]